MMYRLFIRSLLASCLIFVLSGCVSHDEKPKLPGPTTLSKVYPGDIDKVDQIILRDGSTGGRIYVQDKQEIREFLDRIKDEVLSPDPNQEDRVGFIYGITLQEKEETKLAFTLNSIQGIYYQDNPGFREVVRGIFEKAFNKKFGY